MQILKQESNQTSEFNIESANRERRIIFLTGEINTDMAQNVAEQLAYFNYEDQHEPIKLFINSNGGAVMAGLLIYDLIQGSRAPIELYCLEKAFSMAAIIFCSGRHGRYLLPHSQVMVHDLRLSESIGGGNTSSIRELSQEMVRLKSDMDEIISQHTGQPLSQVAQVTKTDSFFKAEEAVKFGFADGVKTFAEMLAI